MNAPVELDTDLEAAVARLEESQRRPVPRFTVAENRFHTHRAKAVDRTRRRGIRSLIRPENADALLAHLPGHPDDRTHCILRGDFVLCDLIPRLLALRGRCTHLRIATLGLSAGNADTLATLVEGGRVAQLTLVVSHYFEQVDKATVFRAVATRLRALGPRCRLVIERAHAKVICIPTAGGDHYVIEGSANLRSSDNLEQMLLVNDPEAHAFHAAWMDELAARHA